MIKSFKLENLDCANCAAKIESEILKIDGVISASVSFMEKKKPPHSLRAFLSPSCPSLRLRRGKRAGSRKGL